MTDNRRNETDQDRIAVLTAELEQLRRNHQTTVDLLIRVIPVALWSAVGSRGALEFLAKSSTTSADNRTSIENSIARLEETRKALAEAVLKVHPNEG